MISGTEYILDGPHAFICDDCHESSRMAYCANRAQGKCHYCGEVGRLQVFKTGPTAPEVVGTLVMLSAIVGLLVWGIRCWFGV